MLLKQAPMPTPRTRIEGATAPRPHGPTAPRPHGPTAPRPHSASEGDVQADNHEHPPALPDQRAAHQGRDDYADHERAQGDRGRGRLQPERGLEEQRDDMGHVVE